GLAHAEDAARVNLSHDRELLEMLRFAVDIGAYIEQDRSFSRRSGENGGQRGTINARQRAQDHLGSRHGCAGIAYSDKPGSTPLADEPQANTHRRIALAAHSSRSLLAHADDFSCMNEVDGQIA